MKVIPRILFWIGTISLMYGIILKFHNSVSEPVSWPLGLAPYHFLEFSWVLYIASIAYCVIFIFMKKEQ